MILAFQSPLRRAGRPLGREFAVNELECLIARKQAAFELRILNGGENCAEFRPRDVARRDQIVAVTSGEGRIFSGGISASFCRRNS